MTTSIKLSYIVCDMINDDSHLSPDLVWMLQSNQIDVDLLTEALVASYYQQIFSSALSRLSYPEEAHRAAQDTLIRAILRKKEYRGNSHMADWIDHIAKEIFTERKYNLKNFHFLNPKLITSIRSHQSEIILSDRDLKLASDQIKSKIKGLRVSKSKWAYAHLFGISILALLIAVLLFSFSETFLAENPKEKLPSSGETLHQADIDVPLTLRDNSSLSQDNLAGSNIAENLPPLTKASSAEEIKQRIFLSSQLWKTMWADVVVSFHGPAAYVGPPYIERHQLWIDQVNGTFQLIGPPQGIPDFIEKIFFPSEDSPNQLGVMRENDYVKLGSQFPWYAIKTETVFLFPYAINYLFSAIEKDLLLSSKLSVVGKEILADREAIILEITTLEDELYARLWLDSQIGIILKEQYYDPHDTEKMIIESNLRKIHFDDATPTRRTSPENSAFASIETYPGSSGLSHQSNSTVPENPMLGFPFHPPPSDFDISQARISFSKADQKDLERVQTGDFYIFANNYFLGKTEILDPRKVICDRSPDGTKIVMANWGIFPTDVNDTIYWFDLPGLDSFQISIPDTLIFQTSISPDNQKILLAGYGEQDGQNKLFLIDAISRTLNQLPVQAGFSSLAWKPDATEIAVLDLLFSPSDFKSSLRIRVFDVQSGAEKRRFIPKEITQGTEIIDVPLDEWTAVFQLPLQDLSRCTLSPDNVRPDLVEVPPAIFNKIVME